MVGLTISCTTQIISKVTLLKSSTASDPNEWVNKCLDKGMQERLADIMLRDTDKNVNDKL
jgi:hypothetical protein